KASRSLSKPRAAVVKVKGQRSGGRRTNNNIRSVLINKRHNKYKIARPQTQLEVINESEKSAGSGSDENDSLLVAYDSSSSLARSGSETDDDDDDDDDPDQGQHLEPGRSKGGGQCCGQPRRRPLRRVYCAVNLSIMGILVAVEIYAQIAIFLWFKSTSAFRWPNQLRTMKGLVLIALSGLILASAQARILPKEDSLWELPEVPEVVNAIEPKAAGCSIKIRSTELKDPQPLLIKSGTSEIVGFSDTGYVDVAKDKTIEFHCTSSLASPLSGKYVTANIDNKEHDLSAIKCTSWPAFVGKKSGSKCNGGTTLIKVGFELSGSRFATQYEVCFNEDEEVTRYVYHRLEPGNNFYATGAVQKETIDKELDMDSAKYFDSAKNVFLARGHMGAKADFVFAPEQRATFLFINAAPQWQTFNAGNWARVEDGVRAWVAKEKKHLYLSHDSNGNGLIPVPKLYFRVVIEPTTKKGIVLIGVNNPHLSLAEIKRDYILCTDVSDKINWISWKKTDITAGYSYACEVPDFLLFLLLLLPSSCDCGSPIGGHYIRRRTKRLSSPFFDEEKTLRLAKYIVSIRSRTPRQFFGDNHFCGGVIRKIIHRSRVLVVAGSPNRLKYQDGITARVPVKKIFVPEKFTVFNTHNIALMMLAKKLPLDNPQVGVINLPTTDPEPGLNYTGGPMASNILHIEVELLAREICEKKLHTFKEEMLCAGNLNNSLDENPCAGDTGSPLIHNETVFGVVSYRIGCGSTTLPSVYTNVYVHLDWINEIMANNAGKRLQHTLSLILIGMVVVRNRILNSWRLYLITI
ncbi:hypothetical protein M5D96_005495, partial [Drosophila gunungcola]